MNPFQNFANKVTGYFSSAPSGEEFLDALGVIFREAGRKREARETGGYIIPTVRTSLGETNSSKQLDGWVKQRQAERLKGMSADSTSQPLVEPEVEREVLGANSLSIPQSIMDYATRYRYSPGGEFGQSRLNEQTLPILWDSIGQAYPDIDPEIREALLASLVAVAQAESGMGGAYGNPNASNYRKTNYWNWFKDGDRGFDPDTLEEMAGIISKGIGGYTLGNQGKFTREGAKKYTGNDNLEFWYDDIYSPAMRVMGY